MFGSFLMIVGANLVVGGIAIAFYIASMECAVSAPAGQCSEGAISLFVSLMASAPGLIYWLMIIAGIFAFYRGRQLRARDRR